MKFCNNVLYRCKIYLPLLLALFTTVAVALAVVAALFFLVVFFFVFFVGLVFFLGFLFFSPLPSCLTKQYHRNKTKRGKRTKALSANGEEDLFSSLLT